MEGVTKFGIDSTDRLFRDLIAKQSRAGTTALGIESVFDEWTRVVDAAIEAGEDEVTLNFERASNGTKTLAHTISVTNHPLVLRERLYALRADAARMHVNAQAEWLTEQARKMQELQEAGDKEG